MSTRIVHRPVRVVYPPTSPAPLELAPPPILPDGRTGGPALQALLPMVGAVSSMTMMVTMRRSPTLVAVGALVLILALVGGLAMLFSQRGQANRSRRLHRERYLDYLEEVSERLRQEETAQRGADLSANPAPSMLPSLIGDPARLWERRRTDPDFLSLRVGIGAVEWRAVTVADQGTPVQPTDPFMRSEAQRVAERYRTSAGTPLIAPLDRAGNVALVGPSEETMKLARCIIAQAAAWHAPDDLAIALICPPERITEWSFMRWLPHLIEDELRDGPLGAIRVSPDGAGLAQLLAGDLAARAHRAAESRRNMATADPGALSQRLLVILDSRAENSQSLPLPDAALTPSAAGLTILQLLSDRLHEPSDTNVRITVGTDSSVAVEVLRRNGPATAELTGTADELPAALLDGLSRSLAPLRLSRSSLAEQAQVGAVDTATLLGFDSPDGFSALRSWTRRSERDFLRVPIGVDDSGAPVLLDLKESAELGMGPHGLCVGATGSGKSELLRSLVAALVATHGPEDVALVLVDYKGGAAFAPFAGLPHIAGLIDNLADDPSLIERAHASLAGEVIRRQRLLKDAGNVAGIAQYRKLREQRQELPPMPHLLVAIDEFGELITAKDDFIELFLTIGRIGRSIGVHLLLSSQRIESGKLRGLDTYLSYRLGLRTFSEAESSVVLESTDAFHLPPLPGYGWLKVDTSVYTRFRASYASGATGPPTADAEPSGNRWSDPLTLRLPPYPGILAANGLGGIADMDGLADGQSMPSRSVSRTQLDELIEAVARIDRPPARTVWLPPLPTRLSLDQIGGGRPIPGVDGLRLPTPTAPMLVPLGLLDDPAQQCQVPWLLDLSAAGGHVALVGGPQSGKTTWLRALAVGLALSHTPRQVAIYGLDLAGGGLGPLREFPHVGGVAARTYPDRLRRTVAELETMLAAREELFAARSLDSLEELRTRHAAGELAELPVAEVVVLIDGAGALRGEFERFEEQISMLLQRGSSYGMHVIASVLRWNDLKMSLQPAFGTRVELRLNDPADSVFDRRLAETQRADRPGRALLADGLFAQTALPRADSQVDSDAMTEALVRLGQATATSWPGNRVPGIRVLPSRVEASEVPDAIEEPAAIAIAIGESTLQPVTVDLLGRDQHLLVFGDAESGKTTLLRTIGSGLVERFSDEDLVIAIYDPRLGLTGLVPDQHLGGLAGNSRLAAGLTAAICKELAARLPDQVADPSVLLRGGQWWQGPQIVLLVDDYDALTAAGQEPLAPFAAYLPAARDIGLHVVLARPVAGSSRGMWDPIVSLVRDSGAPAVVLSGDRGEGPLWPGVYAEAQPPGRGKFIRRGEPSQLVQLVDSGSSGTRHGDKRLARAGRARE